MAAPRAPRQNLKKVRWQRPRSAGLERTPQLSADEPIARSKSLAPSSAKDQADEAHMNSTISSATCASNNGIFKDSPHSTLSTQCGNAERPVDYVDDALASSLSDTFASLSNSHSSQVPFPEMSADIIQEEEYGEALRLEIERQRQEMEQLRLTIQHLESRHADSLQRLSSRKAKFALQQGGGPVNWGITVQQLEDFTNMIKAPLRSYSLDHRYERGTWTHVCCNSPCLHDHGCARHRGLHPGEDATLLSPVDPNMHTVVQVFIRPSTMDCHGSRGLALKMNAHKPRKVEKFVSHSWSGRYEDFVATLARNLLPETVVFICSFALPQNLDVGPILGVDLEGTPFALAHNIAEEVLLVIDSSIDVLERIWVIFELYLSLKRDKPIQIALTRAGSEFRSKITEKVRSMDVRTTKATQASDLQAIMGAIAGVEDIINMKICTKLAEKVHQLEACLHHENSKDELSA